MNDGPIGRIRAVCLAFPEATEKTSWATIPTFRVRDKIFAQIEDNHHDSGRLALWCNAKPGMQAQLVESQPERFFRPPYVAHLGWIGIHLDIALDPEQWDEIDDLIDDAYRLTAPKRLLATLDDR